MKKILQLYLVSLITIVSFIPVMGILPALAQTTSSTSPSPALKAVKDAKQAERMKKIITKANQEIDRRVAALNKLGLRVEKMKRVSDTGKKMISSIVQTQIADLNSLKEKINTDTDLDTLRTDVKSITVQYRIFMLIIPQGHILVAADRLTAIATMMTDISAKLQTRIMVIKSAGGDTASLEEKLTEVNEKITDAMTQAKAAESTVITLVPDNDDAAQMKNNKTALMEAHKKIKIGMQDIIMIRKDIYAIIEGIKALNVIPSLSSSPSASPTATLLPQ